MSNINLGLVVIAIFLAIFGATVLFIAPFLAGHVALAILCACMAGMWAGVFIIEGN